MDQSKPSIVVKALPKGDAGHTQTYIANAFRAEKKTII